MDCLWTLAPNVQGGANTMPAGNKSVLITFPVAYLTYDFISIAFDADTNGNPTTMGYSTHGKTSVIFVSSINAGTFAWISFGV